MQSDQYVAVREFRAMGTDCAVRVFGADDRFEALADLAKTRVDILESLWSRFKPASELSRMNAAAGHGPFPVSWETGLLVRRMKQAWEQTSGSFDPTVLTAVRANGYDRDYLEVRTSPAANFDLTEPAPGMSQIRIDEGCVELPAGVGLDPGAIGKGLAADIIADEIAAAGATGVLVDLGGDIAMIGSPGVDDAWRVAIRDERTGEPSGRAVEFSAPTIHAAITTSTSLTRRFADSRHHVINPQTGESCDEQLVQVTVAGTRAWECEVWATAAMVDPWHLDSMPADLSCLALTTAGNRRDDFGATSASAQRKVA